MKRYIAEEFTGGAWSPLLSRLDNEPIAFDNRNVAVVCADLFDRDAVRIIDTSKGVEVCRHVREPRQPVYRPVPIYDPNGRETAYCGRGVML